MSVDILGQLRYRGTFGLQKKCKDESGDAADDTLHWRPSWQATGRRVTRGWDERGARSTQFDNEKRIEPV
jgi:hypothetical protein